MAPTASSLSAVLTALTLLAVSWRPNAPWRPQPLLASADRPKFLFGGRRREREPVKPHITEPDLLDEVAGGRYGGGQTLLPTLGGSADPASERKLPRLYPDAQGPDRDDHDDLDDGGFDDDLIGSTNSRPSESAPAHDTWHASELPPPPPPPPIYTSAAIPRETPVGLMPPPPPSTPTPADANWRRELGMLGAIASMGSDDGSTVDGESNTKSDPWATPSRGGEAATAELPLEQRALAPFSDIAPLESWEQRTPPESPPALSWLSFPGESPQRSTGLEGPQHAPGTDPPSVRHVEPETGAWTPWKYETGHTLPMEPEKPAFSLPAAPTPEAAQLPQHDDLSVEAASDEPAFDGAALDAAMEPLTFDALEFATFAEYDHSDVAFDEPFDLHAFVRATDEADPSDRGASDTAEPVVDPVDNPVDERVDEPRPPTVAFSFALPEITQAWDKFAARKGIDVTSLEPFAETLPEAVAVAVAEVHEPQPATSSWSDIFDIFQDDEDAAEPETDLLDADLDDADLDDADFDDADFDDAVAATPVEMVIVGSNADSADGDRWASTLLDRLRAVVATPAEPVEALDEFNERFERGLRLRLTEQQVIDYLGQGVQMIAPEAEAQVLIGHEGSSLTEMATLGQQTRAGCGVADTDMCPAIVQDETLRFDNSTVLDACPFLSARASGACAAVCIPIGETGTTRGVVHITTLLNAALPDPTVAAVERSATQISGRLIALGATRRNRPEPAGSPRHEPARAYDEPLDSRV